MNSRWKTLTGQRFGRLVVKKQDKSKTIYGNRAWLCECDCGNTTTVPTCHLNNGNTKSCGCLKEERIHPNLVGKVFGKLTVIEPSGVRKTHSLWKCRCECGGEKFARTSHLKSGRIRSCGCLRSGMLRNGAKSLPPNEAMRNIVVRMYKANASKKNIEFDLDIEEMERLFSSDCHYCGSRPSRIRKRKDRPGKFVYNGIDRKDNNKGYISGNVVPCCTTCNLKKGSMNHDEFLSWIKMVASNLS